MTKFIAKTHLSESKSIHPSTKYDFTVLSCLGNEYKCSLSQLIRCVPLLAASSRAGLPLRYTSHDYLYLVTLLTLPPNN